MGGYNYYYNYYNLSVIFLQTLISEAFDRNIASMAFTRNLEGSSGHSEVNTPIEPAY